MRRQSKQLHIPLRLTALLAALLLCASLWVPAVAADTPYSGNLGPIKWSVSAGLLTITGTGAIPDFSEQNPAPWSGHSDVISRVELGSGITRIGALAFYDHKLIKSVSLPHTVKTVGDMAFAGCETLTTVVMPKVTAIGEYAFSRCFALDGVMLPETLTTLSAYAFYRCESLSYIRIPASVTSLGGSAFAYCDGLLRADIDAPVESLPEWFFYGCERLQSVTLPPVMSGAGDDAFTRCDGLQHVYYTGDDDDLGTLIEDIAQSLPHFSVGNISSAPDAQPPALGYDATVQGDTLKVTDTEVSTGADLVVRVEQTTSYPVADDGTTGDPKEIDTTIHATITGTEGWNSIVGAIKKEELEHSTFELDHGDQSPVDVQITLQEDTPLSGDWLSQMAGRDATVTVTTPDGSRWSINGEHIAGYTFEKNYQLSYTLTPYENVADGYKTVVGTAPCWWLSFHSAFNFPVTVEVFLDPLAVRQNATLYENVKNQSLTKLHAAMVDHEGYVSFRMGNVNSSTRYLLALNVSGTSAEDVVVPDGMVDNPDDLVDLVPLDERYTITDVRGFLGLTMGEFTQLVLTVGSVFLGVVLLLVLFFTIYSKRKAKIAAIRAEVFGVSAVAQGVSPSQDEESHTGQE